MEVIEGEGERLGLSLQSSPIAPRERRSESAERTVLSPRPSLAGLRVLAIAPTSFFRDYGCHVRIVEETAALATHGIESTIATYPFGRDLPGVRIRRALKLPGPEHIDPGSSLRKLSLDIALAARALAVAWSERPALIHGHLHEGALIGWAVARRQGIPIVFDFQGSLTSEMQDHGFLASRGPAYRFFRALEEWIVHRADAVITSTRNGADVLVREFGIAARRITVVADAVNVHTFRPLREIAGEDGSMARTERLRRNLGIPERVPVIVYLGLLAEYQGSTHLLRAAKLLDERGIDAHFLIMGFPGEHRYRALAEALGLGDRVTFTGAIPYELAPVHLALGDIAVSPKLSETEGNGKLLNYIAMGLPTVAFDTAVSREILGDLGVYAPRGDWTALALEIEGLIRDPAAAAERGLALRAQAVAEHSWESSVESLLDVYSRLLGAG